MTIATDTDDLVATTLWGESLEIVRNTVSYDDMGGSTDSWAVIITVNADIQPISGINPTVGIGQERASSHRMFLPDATGVKQGDRVRPVGWVTGDDEYTVDAVLTDEGHVEIRMTLVVGHG